MSAVNTWIRGQPHASSAIHVCDTRAAVAAAGMPDHLSESPDGLHPSASGYRLMALALEPVIRQALGAPAGAPLR